jgi:hypothetical protein
MDLHANVGDRIVIDSVHLGESRREGEVLEVLGEGETTHYRMRWEDGHESLFYPASSAHIVSKGES